MKLHQDERQDPDPPTAEDIAKWVCRVCRLNDFTDVVDRDGSPTQWVDANLCSRCQDLAPAHPIVEYSVPGERGIATMAALAALKRWLAAVDRANESAGRSKGFPPTVQPDFWPMIHRRDEALKVLEEAARALERAS